MQKYDVDIKLCTVPLLWQELQALVNKLEEDTLEMRTERDHYQVRIYYV